jgi:hypothetical protein
MAARSAAYVTKTRAFDFSKGLSQGPLLPLSSYECALCCSCLQVTQVVPCSMRIVDRSES